MGDKVKFAGERQRWDVRAVTRGGRFVILTKPFNLRHTVLYTVVDFDRGVRGKDDRYGLGYEIVDDIARALHSFQRSEDGAEWDDAIACEHAGRCSVRAEVSHRSANHIRLDFQSVNGVATDWAGRVADGGAA